MSNKYKLDLSISFFLFLVFIILSTSAVLAHGVNLDAYVEEPQDPAELENTASESEGETVKEVNTLSEERLRIIIREELDKKLSPIQHELAEINNSGPGITEIIGGIGYIFGLMGLYLYFKKRED